MQAQGCVITSKHRRASAASSARFFDALVNKAYARQIRADLATLAEILTEHTGGEPS